MEKRQHPVGLKRHGVDSDVQLALICEEWKKPSGLNLLARVAIHDERCVVPAPEFEAVGPVRKRGPHPTLLNCAAAAVAVQFAK